MKCENCGNEVREGAKFCSKCGSNILEQQEDHSGKHNVHALKDLLGGTIKEMMERKRVIINFLIIIQGRKMNENKEKTAGNLANSVVEGYDYSVAVRMSGRAGAYSPTGGKGNAFEVMYSDKKNLSNLLKPDTTTTLTNGITDGVERA